MLIKYKQEHLFLCESPRAFQFEDDLIDGMALQPEGVQPKIISLPWVDFSLSWLGTPFTVHTGSVQREYERRSTNHSRRLAGRRPGSLSSFNQANLHSLVRTDGITTCVVVF